MDGKRVVKQWGKVESETGIRLLEEMGSLPRLLLLAC